MNISSVTFTVPIPARPKQRPRLGGSKVYNNKEYTRWKSTVRLYAIREAAKAGWELSTRSPISIVVTIYPDKFRVTLTKIESRRHGRADLDNLIGGIADALQPKRLRGKSVGVGLFSDDKQVHYISAIFEDGE